jgi:2-oxoisovalerate dehydrogenase E1 component
LGAHLLLKRKGDAVAEGEMVAEVETDKAVVEIEAPSTGRLRCIDHDAGATLAMGQRIGTVRPR